MIIVSPMLNALDKQFKLTDGGTILFQPDPTNPLPGKVIGTVKKGTGQLIPDAVFADGLSQDEAERGRAWLRSYIGEVLQPLVALADEEPIQEQARTITLKLQEALGILPRSALEEAIAGLDEAGRAALRQRKVRLGPVLVFLPSLNKPAAVRLRALLWTVWRGGALPADFPPDGTTSVSVADKNIDPVYYRAIGYPVYGPRAIRVDMLDRLISAVYDSADKGIFKARHDMAEWLGCSIPDLYAVLEAMGHVKEHDPADQAPADNDQPEKTEEAGEAVAEKPALPQEKPDLATFRLRRGKAYGQPPREKAPPKKFVKRPQEPKRPPPKERRDNVVSASVQKKLEHSPFAVLKDLKIQKKD